jgi:ABC transporter ATM
LQNINSILKEKKRTSVFVAHRLRTIYDSDQILVLKDGRVAEMGSHRELLDLNGIYAELWNGECTPQEYEDTDWTGANGGLCSPRNVSSTRSRV